MTNEMELVVAADGSARCIDDEALDPREIGKLQITRASHVEPDAEGYWWADMGPSGGPLLGPYGSSPEAFIDGRGGRKIAADSCGGLMRGAVCLTGGGGGGRFERKICPWLWSSCPQKGSHTCLAAM